MEEKYMVRDGAGKYYTGDIATGYWTTKLDDGWVWTDKRQLIGQFRYAKTNSQLKDAVQPIEIITILD